MTPEEVESWATQIEERTFGYSPEARRDLSVGELNLLLREWEANRFDDKAIARIIRARYLGPKEGE